jgi:hypothetical protein
VGVLKGGNSMTLANGHTPLPTSYIAGVFATNAADERRQRLQEVVANQMTLFRRDLTERLALDPRRDLNRECGFPETSELTPQRYQELFDRNPFASRAVEVMEREAYSCTPSVYEDEDSETVTEFETDWDGLGAQLRGEQSWFQEEEGSLVWEALCRAGINAGIGRYGVLLIGFDDGKPLDQPVDGVMDGKRPSKKRRLLYLRSFPESLAPITRYETDQANPRYGQPTEYLITFSDPQQDQGSSIGMPLATQRVHWTRVIHLARTAENAGPSEWLATPILRPLVNNLMNLDKVYGSDGEAFWKNCLIKLLLESDPDVQGNPADHRDAIENFANSLQPYLGLAGFKAKTVAPAVVDPTAHVEVNVMAICVKLTTPKRVFMGSEVGQLASIQDRQSWDGRVRGHRKLYTTPKVIVPFVDRLIAAGVLAEPKGGKPTVNRWQPVRNAAGKPVADAVQTTGGYRVQWPLADSLTADEKATIALQRTQAMAAYVAGGLNVLMSEMDYLTRELHYTEEEAQTILDNTEAEQAKRDEEAQALADEHGMVPAPPPGFKAAEVPKPPLPVKVKAGESLVHPETGQMVATVPTANTPGVPGFDSDEQRRAFFGLKGEGKLGRESGKSAETPLAKSSGEDNNTSGGKGHEPEGGKMPTGRKVSEITKDFLNLQASSRNLPKEEVQQRAQVLQAEIKAALPPLTGEHATQAEAARQAVIKGLGRHAHDLDREAVTQKIQAETTSPHMAQRAADTEKLAAELRKGLDAAAHITDAAWWAKQAGKSVDKYMAATLADHPQAKGK